jgi:hypothetical protein
MPPAKYTAVCCICLLLPILLFCAAQMQEFGWRIPFLLSIVSASAAVALRMHMPEPEEFTRERKEVIQHNLQRIASQRASSFMSRSSSTASAGAAAAPGSFKLAGSFKSLGLKTVDSLTLNRQQKLKQQQQQNALSPQGSETASMRDVQLQQLYSLSEDAPTTAAGPAAANYPTSNGNASIAIEGAAGVPEKQGEYVPAVRLLRKHWIGVLLQFLFEAWVSIGFWVISTWLPLQLRKAPVFMPEKLTQAMLIVNLTVMGAVQLAAGYASDRGMPRVWSCFAVFTLAAGISVPVFIGFARASAAGCWLLHLLLMVLMGWVLGLVPGEGALEEYYDVLDK